MGLFDRVWAKCPACGGRVEFQSKGGECAMLEYSADDVPVNVAGDCSTGRCDDCKREFRAALASQDRVRIVPVAP